MQVTKSEIVKIITAIRVQCPEALPYRNETEFSVLVDMWFDILKGYPKEIVWAAVRNALKNTVYQKQNWIGAISQEIERLRASYEKSDTELWAELTSVLREVDKCAYAFRYNAIDYNGKTQGDNARDRVEEIFNNLSPELKEYCRTQRGLIEIAAYTPDELTFERGRFMRTIPQLKERQRVKQETPEQLAGLIQGLADNLAIESKTKLLKGD